MRRGGHRERETFLRRLKAQLRKDRDDSGEPWQSPPTAVVMTFAFLNAREPGCQLCVVAVTAALSRIALLMPLRAAVSRRPPLGMCCEW